MAVDDLKWTCYSNSAARQAKSVTQATTQNFKITPNPITNQEIIVKGEIKDIKRAEIYTLQGKVIQTIDRPFRNGNVIRTGSLNQGVYILKLDGTTLQFLVK